MFQHLAVGIWESDMSMIVGLKTNGNGLSFDFKAYPSVGDGQITLECDPEKLPALWTCLI